MWIAQGRCGDCGNYITDYPYPEPEFECICKERIAGDKRNEN